MRYVILSDAHGNKLYFDECMRVIDEMNIQYMVYLGDLFGYMSDGLHILKTLQDRKAHILKGNHEAMLLGEIELNIEKDRIYGLGAQREKLSDNNRIFLNGLESAWTAKCKNGKILFVHGAPFDPLNGYLYEDDQEYLWEDMEYCFVFMGHTHRPYIKCKNRTTYVNVGSCGLPRDIGLLPSFCVFDDIRLTAEIIRVQMNPMALESGYYAGISDNVLDVLRRK